MKKSTLLCFVALFFATQPSVQLYSQSRTGNLVGILTKSAPKVASIKRQSPLTATTNLTSVTFRVLFSEKVIGVDAGDFKLTVVSGTVTGVIASNAVTSVGTAGTTYDVAVTSITGNGVIRLDLKSSGTGIIDANGNSIKGGYSSGETYTIAQNTTPTLTSVTIASNNANSSLAKPGDIITLRFTASEPINAPSVTIATHAVTAVAGASNSFTATYTMLTTDAAGVVPFSINFSSTAGVAGAQVTSTTNSSRVTFDKTAPGVTSINRQNPLTETTTATSVTFRTTFSEKVSAVDATDFVLTRVSGTTTGVIASNAVTAVGTAGTTYDVAVTSLTGNGVIRLDLKSSGTGIIDAAGNAISGGFTGGQTYTLSQAGTPPPSFGFASVTPLSPVELLQSTKDKPQAKAWTYSGKWWCVLSATAGTKVYRLDGTSWTDILTLNAKGSKPDCRVVGDLTHVLLYKGSSNNSLLFSLKYDPVSDTYKLWSQRPTSTAIVFPKGSETATIVIDGTGRMWAASDDTSHMSVWWSDAPYSTWSSPITVATGTKDDDICALVSMPGQNKIGLFWSNQNTKRFGFKTHTNGADPTVWSADEIPASQSALNVGVGFADDHMNLKVGSDGTIYCAAKTGYNTNGYAKVILLIRRPAGTWDNAYTVTNNPEGTQPIVILNEAQRKLKVIYATVENGGDIVYRESSMDNISFTTAINLISSPGVLYDYSTSTHQNYTSEIVILATNLSSTPLQAVGVIASDETSSTLTKSGISKDVLPENNPLQLQVYPNPFSATSTLHFTLPTSGEYTLSLYNATGTKQRTLQNGTAEAGVQNTVRLDGHTLPNGLYLVSLQTNESRQTIKVLLNR